MGDSQRTLSTLQHARFDRVLSWPVRVVAFHDEQWTESPLLNSPDACVQILLQYRPIPDIFTFAHAEGHVKPSGPFHLEWDNEAVVDLHRGFAFWWETLPQESRKNVRRSQRRGVSVLPAKFDDDFVRGIAAIYNETPIRQGRRFPHYGKPLCQIRDENASYLERSELIGAYFQGQLIGFIKMVRVRSVYRIMQIVCLDAHQDKRPTNALLAKAVEIGCNKGGSQLVYGKFVYGTKESSPMTEFKRRNGFTRMEFPRYYVPLTRWGRLAISCNCHQGVKQSLPEPLVNLFLRARASFYAWRFRQHLRPQRGEQNHAETASRKAAPAWAEQK